MERTARFGTKTVTEMIPIPQKIKNIEGGRMPNGSTHRLTGMVAACAVPIFLNKNNEFIPIELTACAITGYSLGSLPDILEPAFHPNHRNFFHSIVFGAVLGYGGVKIWNEVKKRREISQADEFDWEGFILTLILVIIVVYLFHLMLDGFTKKGLPLV